MIIIVIDRQTTSFIDYSVIEAGILLGNNSNNITPLLTNREEEERPPPLHYYYYYSKHTLVFASVL